MGVYGYTLLRNWFVKLFLPTFGPFLKFWNFKLSILCVYIVAYKKHTKQILGIKDTF